MDKLEELNIILQDEEKDREYLKFERFCIQNENKEFVREQIKIKKSWYPKTLKVKDRILI